MSKVYLAIVNEDADISEMIDYMDESWPCTMKIKECISERVDEARKIRKSQIG